MTQITNRLGLPEAIVRAIQNDPYDDQGSDATVTELEGPPRLGALRRAHRHEIIEDASERIWSLWGKAMHMILETAGRDLPQTLTEERLFTTVAGWRVSGALDTHSLLDGLLSDYKNPSWYAVRDGAKQEYVGQLNILALLLREHGYEVRTAEIVALIRDWRPSDAKRFASEGYPSVPVMRIPVPLWTPEEQRAHLRQRVRLHQIARQALAAGSLLPFCSAEERWQRKTTWAVMKDGNVRATKVCATEDEALAVIGEAKKMHVEKRPGLAVRCQEQPRYCPIRTWCIERNDGQWTPAELLTSNQTAA